LELRVEELRELSIEELREKRFFDEEFFEKRLAIC